MDHIGVFKILEKLVSFETVSPPGNEAEAASYLANLLTAFGLQCRVQELGNDRANLIAVLDGKEPGPELMLNGHLDVVPAQGLWSSDPFEVKYSEDGKLFGRGTADMKGGVAAMCAAAMETASEGGITRGRLKLLFVADEECSNLGTRAYMKEYGPSDYGIIGEPTGLAVAAAHRGVSRDYIEFTAPARHAALPSREKDAVEKMASFVLQIREINKKLAKLTHPLLPSPGISVTKLEGYEKDNVVPGKTRILLDFRILPGMHHEAAVEILQNGLALAGIADARIESHFYMPGGEISQEDPFVLLCAKKRQEILKTEEPICAYDASCEQCFLVEHGTKTVICGPGNLAQAHTVNEFINRQQILQAVSLYKGIIKEILI